MVLDRLDGGAPPADALAATVKAAVAEAPGSRLNLVLGDGHVVHAVAWGDSLVARCAGGATVVASEPSDDAGGWEPVPDASVVRAGAGELAWSAL